MVDSDSADGNSRRSFLKLQAGVATAGVAGLAGCSFFQSEEMELRYNCGTQAESALGRVVQWTADYVNENADGVTIETFFGGELGDIIESMESVSAGTLDMYTTLFSLGGVFYNPMMAFDAPYLYEDFDHLLEATDPTQSEVMQEANEGFVEESNIRALGAGVQGIRRTTVAGDPVYHPDDFGDRQIRAVPIDVMFETVRGLGGDPVEIDFSELPNALATGSVDGQENPYSDILASSLHENQDYVIETDHIHAALPVYISEDTWTELNDDQQDVFFEAVSDAQQQSVEFVQNEVPEIKDTIRDDGVEIIEADEIEMEAFKSQARSHVREQFPEFTDIWDEISYEPYE